MRLLELFSGTGSVGEVARFLSYEVVSLDLTGAIINCDIMEWDYKKEYPVGHFDIIWASPPCETFSRVRACNIGRYGITRESLTQDMIEKGLPILRKAEEIIEYFKPRLYFIENPQAGHMKDFIVDRPFYDVDYCKYSDWGMRKRTRIWTNKINFTPKVCKKDCGYIVDGRHLRCAVGGKKHQKGQGSGTDKRLRYRVPYLLVEELLLDIN